MSMEDRMIEASERGECSYEGAYEHVRESMADSADRARDRRKENAITTSEERRDASARLQAFQQGSVPRDISD